MLRSKDVVGDTLINKNNFKFFFQEYFEPVFQFARKYTEDKDIARDIAQNAFIKVYERRTDFDAYEQAKSFAYITARNLCLDHLKHKKIEQQYMCAYLLDEEAEQQFFTEEMEYQETLWKLQKAIDNLPTQSKKIIQISLEGKTNNEIAAQLNISINTVKTLKKNAYKFLYDTLNSLIKTSDLFCRKLRKLLDFSNDDRITINNRILMLFYAWF